MSKNMTWELCSHVIFGDLIGIYYLKCNICDHKEIYIANVVADNVADFKAHSINTLVTVELEFPLVNFLYTYIFVPWKINV